MSRGAPKKCRKVSFLPPAEKTRILKPLKKRVLPEKSRVRDPGAHRRDTGADTGFFHVKITRF